MNRIPAPSLKLGLPLGLILMAATNAVLPVKFEQTFNLLASNGQLSVFKQNHDTLRLVKRGYIDRTLVHSSGISM